MQMWSGESLEFPVLHKEPQVTKHCLRTEKNLLQGKSAPVGFPTPDGHL